jgi:hypothetical protein
VEMRGAEIGRCEHFDRAIAKGACDGKALPPETDGPVIVASDDALYRHEGGSPPEPVLVSKRSGEHLRLVECSLMCAQSPNGLNALRRSKWISMVSSVASRVPGRGRTATSACSRWATASRSAPRATRSPA